MAAHGGMGRVHRGIGCDLPAVDLRSARQSQTRSFLLVASIAGKIKSGKELIGRGDNDAKNDDPDQIDVEAAGFASLHHRGGMAFRKIAPILNSVSHGKSSFQKSSGSISKSSGKAPR